MISQKELMLIKQVHQNNVNICHYWYFKGIGFKYEPYPCNSCHDLMQKAMSFHDVDIVYLKEGLIKFTFGI